MKKQFLLFAAFLLAITLPAQEEADPVVIVSTKGKVSLLPQGQTAPLLVEAGAVAKNTGQLKLAKGAQAVVYCQGQFKTLTGKQNAALSELCANNGGKRSVNADYDFGNKLMAAVEMVAVAKRNGDGWGTSVGDPKKSGDGWGTSVGDPKKSGDGWGTSVGDPKKSGDGWGTSVGDPKKSGDGWGGKGARIVLILPFGKVSAATTTFSWSKPEAAAPYQLVILDESDKVIHNITVQDTFAQIALQDLNLSTEQLYRWKVSMGGSKPLESNELSFAIGSAEDYGRAIKNAGSSPLASSTQSPSLCKLVEAVALEKGEWFYDAAQTYAKTKQKNDPMARMMHAAFWMRYGFRRLAEKAARG